MDTIIEKTRNIIEDNLITTGRDVFTFESSSSSKIFTLTENNVSVSSIIVLKNGVVWSASNYNYSSTTGKLTVTGSLSAGDSLEVDYSYYNKYSDSEIRGHIKASISYLSVEKYKTFAVKSDNIIFPTPTESEENLIAVISSILIKGSIRSYKTPELTITFLENESKEAKIRHSINQFRKTYGILDYIYPGEKIIETDEGLEL